MGRDLPDDIAARLGQRLAGGEFGAGERLPSERALAAEYGVSRAVVREALSHLKSDGLVEARAGSGVFVTENREARSFRMTGLDLDGTEALAQVMELLEAVEVAATRSAALHRDAADLKAIRRALIGMEYAIASDELGDEQDFAFHQAIVEATHNPHFVSLCKHLEFGARDVIRKARANTRANLSDLLDAVQAEHQAIYRAIAEGDPEAAAAAAACHLRNAAERTQLYRHRERGA
ncbi:FadR family transcriptional regulator [Rhodovulum sulfidophilum]|uniref:FadR family transcriptional regulator n=1 Tax=Rhodovulum sulfidophilum TaxID=35806 RepID=A0ABS1RW29_RHOSU|nr:FadR/GntR family transcriptional regulator [Rhodovulum sulfidophilum]MBL3560890.1 FadR family transcriptional regulator [Rhodovulum sulfidophilum]MBL3567322.1 FadR family transcriptional regulator [Rhodovulum sulfidophilum]MBL3586056.1 FadR family transcriptional regulator [Rhodovulum sulfidophilum]MBL3595398.1 FadR family transcriptional regulator [Rhodovulum sulfidophilum]MBL3609335.1 FadR family transcriptional regulator [Rhodovulum sulfidophilum]